MNPRYSKCRMPIALAIACLLMGSLSHGQSTKKPTGDAPTNAKAIAWRSDYNAALAESASTGKPVLADFTAEWCGYCKKLDQNTFSDAKVIQSVNANFIPVKVDADENRNLMQQFEVSGLPTAVIIRGNGEAVSKVVGYREAPTYLADLVAAVKQMGDMAPLSGPAQLQKAFDAAEKLFTKGRYGAAYALFKKLADQQSAFAQIEDAKKRIDEIDAKASESLAAAKTATESKDFAAAMTALKELAANFSGTKAAAEAKALQKDLAENPEAKEALRTGAATEQLAQATEEIEAKKYNLAITRLANIATNFADTAAGTEAKETLAKLKSDASIMGQAEDEAASGQCKAWLSLAKSWEANGRPEKARDYLKRIIEIFPNSSFAKQAEARLEKLR